MMKSKEKIKNQIDSARLEIKGLENRTILAEDYTAAIKYYKGLIAALEWVTLDD